MKSEDTFLRERESELARARERDEIRRHFCIQQRARSIHTQTQTQAKTQTQTQTQTQSTG